MTISRCSLAGLFLIGFCGTAFAFELSVPAISDGNWSQRFLATECGGQNLSPAISWKDAPSGTKSFVLTMFDRNALDGFGWWLYKWHGVLDGTAGLPPDGKDNFDYQPPSRRKS